MDKKKVDYSNHFKKKKIENNANGRINISEKIYFDYKDDLLLIEKTKH